MASCTISYFRVAIVCVLLTKASGECYESSVGVANISKVGNSQMSASSVFNITTPAANGRLNYTSGSSWCASSRDSTPYLQVDLGSVYIICGVATQGNSQADQWVRTYQVQYSTDGTIWTMYQENKKNRTFEGNYERNTVVKRILYDGIQAQYVRVLPSTFYGGNCLRVELYGLTKKSCEMNAIGLSSEITFPDHRFSASSYFNYYYTPYVARFGETWGWTPRREEYSTGWLRIDIGSVYFLCAISTLGQGTYTDRGYIKNYTLKYTLDNIVWNFYKEAGQKEVSQACVVFPLVSITLNTEIRNSLRKYIKQSECSDW